MATPQSTGKPRGPGTVPKGGMDKGGTAGKETWKAAGKHAPAAAGSSNVPASAYNPISGTFHSLDPGAVATESAPPPQNGRYKSFTEGEESRVVPELDTMSNNGSCSEESEDQQRAMGGGVGGQGAGVASGGGQGKDPSGASGAARGAKMKAKNEKKHQRAKERKLQELNDKCVQYLNSRKLEKLAGQLVGMGFTKDQSIAALVSNDGSLERSVTWLIEGGDGGDRQGGRAAVSLKLDISDELAVLADMESRHGYSRPDIERAVVGAEGDLDRALTSLKAKQSLPITPPDTCSPSSSAPASPGLSLGSSPAGSAHFHGRHDPTNHFLTANIHSPYHPSSQGQGPRPGYSPNSLIRPNGIMHSQQPGNPRANGALTQAMHDLRKDDRQGNGAHGRWPQVPGVLPQMPGQPRYLPPQQADATLSSSRAPYQYSNGGVDGARAPALPVSGFRMTSPGGTPLQKLPYVNGVTYQQVGRVAVDPRSPQAVRSAMPVAGRFQPLAPAAAPSLSPQRPSSGMGRPLLAHQPQQSAMLSTSPGWVGMNGHLQQHLTPGSPADGLLAGPGVIADPFWKGALSAAPYSQQQPYASRPAQLPAATAAAGAHTVQRPLLQQEQQRVGAGSVWPPAVGSAGGEQLGMGDAAVQVQARNGFPAALTPSDGLLEGWGGVSSTSKAISSVDWSMRPGGSASLQSVDWSVSKAEAPVGLWSAMGSLSIGQGGETGLGASRDGSSERSYNLWGGGEGGAAVDWKSTPQYGTGSEVLKQESTTHEWTSPFAGKDLFPLSNSLQSGFR